MDCAFGAPDIYEVQVIEAALCTDENCTNPVVLNTGSATFDLGDSTTNPNQDVGALPDSAEVEPGTYSFLMIRVSRNINILGTIPFFSGSSNCSTPGGTTVVGFADNEENGSAGVTSYQVIDLNLPIPGGGSLRTEGNDLVIIIPLNPPLVVEDGDEVPEVSVAFNIDEALISVFTSPGAFDGGDECRLVLGTPSVTIRIGSIEVDVTLQDATTECSDLLDEVEVPE